jgi:hypothetical protein
LRETINEASRTFHADKSIPKDLMDCMDELDKECQSAQKAMSSQDENLIRQCIDDMEERRSRRARRFEQAGAVDAKVKGAVDTMHRTFRSKEAAALIGRPSLRSAILADNSPESTIPSEPSVCALASIRS